MKHVPISHSFMTMHLTDKIIFAMDIYRIPINGISPIWKYLVHMITGIHSSSHPYHSEDGWTRKHCTFMYPSEMSWSIFKPFQLTRMTHTKEKKWFEKPEVPTIVIGSLNRATNEMTLHIMRTDSHHVTIVHTRVYPQIWIRLIEETIESNRLAHWSLTKASKPLHPTTIVQYYCEDEQFIIIIYNHYLYYTTYG